jgi:hypothetical protein
MPRRKRSELNSREVQFYQHEVGWANRLIGGDSLLVVNSLPVTNHFVAKGGDAGGGAV